MRDQRDLGFKTEATHMHGAGDRRLRDLFRARVVTNMRVGEEIDARGSDDQRQSREILHSRRKPDDIANMIEARREAPFEAADQRIRLAAPKRQRANDVGEERTTMRATSGVTPFRSAASR